MEKKRIYKHRPYQPTANLSKISEEQKEKVKNLYLQGLSQSQIERDLKMTRKTIRTILKNTGIDRTKSEQWRKRWGSSLNECVFDELTPEALYWIGFLYADGHVRKDEAEYSIEIEIELKDREHLVKFAQFLECNKEPKQYSDNSCTLRIYSKKINRRLKELGLHHNKSYTAKPHELLKDSRDFWRGVVDGDGGVYTFQSTGYNVNQLSLCGTLETILDFIIFCSKQCNIKDKYPSHSSKSKSLYQVHYYSSDAIKITDLLYKDSTIYLDRKYQKYLEFIDLNKLVPGEKV
jgi:hypothetical protein